MQASVLLKTCQVIALPSESMVTEIALSPLQLQWRGKVLFVRAMTKMSPNFLPVLNNQEWLVDCLRHSSVQIVYLFPSLGEKTIIFWANACQQAGKKVAIKITRREPKYFYSLNWLIKRSLDWLASALLLLILSPLFLGLAVLILMSSPGPLFFRQWRVGYKGRLFQIIKFRSMIVDAEKMHHKVMGNQRGLHKSLKDPRVFYFGQWLRRYSLDELPQLINVLRGEMSLVGPRPWALYDALRIKSPAGRHRLTALPGMTGAWQVKARSHLLDLEAVNQCDLDYLDNWSLWQDMKILFLTIPKVISGSGAY